MLCPTCRDVIPEESTFCPSCLADLEEEPGTRNAQPAARRAVAAPRRVPQIAVEPASFEERFPDARPCPAHPQMPLVGTCARCGNFTCVRCAPGVVASDDAACLSCRPAEQEVLVPGEVSIGGWLYLLAIQLVLSALAWPLMAILLVAGGALGARLSLTFAVLLLLSLGMTALSGFTLVQFFERKRTAPVLIIVSLVAAALVEGVQTALSDHSSGGVVSTGGAMVIWISYLLISDRAKRTFVR
jgi:hypothetical protein